MLSLQDSRFTPQFGALYAQESRSKVQIVSQESPDFLSKAPEQNSLFSPQSEILTTSPRVLVSSEVGSFTLMGPYLGILAIMALATTLCVVFATISWILGPKRNTAYKNAPYECGVAPLGDARERFPIKFYLVAILFILFDIEVVFLWSWMTAYKDAPLEFVKFTFIEFLTYMATWILGYAYAIHVGATDWDESTQLPESSGH